MFKTLIKGIDDKIRGSEIHIGYPHWDNLLIPEDQRSQIVFDTVCALAVNDLIKIIMHVLEFGTPNLGIFAQNLFVIPVKPKKSLGQHFLTDKNIARKIVDSLTWTDYHSVLEIGPGMGVLSEYLLEIPDKDIRFIEIDQASVEYLTGKFNEIKPKIIRANALYTNFSDLFNQPFAVIGNFPYNISSQLFFKVLESRDSIRETVCMIQKEVAVRLASPPGSRAYGILSVLLQAWFQIEYLFTVPPQVFNPPPKVQSAVIRLRRNNTLHLGCNEDLFKKVVKTAFNQRRKTLRNSLRNILLNLNVSEPFFQKRPEQLGVNEFVSLTLLIESATSGPVTT